MSQSPTKTVYDPVAQLFHWFTALAIAAMFALAAAMESGFEGELRRALYTSHKTLGVLILLTTFARLGWRIVSPPPALAALKLKRWESGLAHLTHFGLYLMCFLVPFSGWAMVSSGPHGIQLFGIIPFPPLPVGAWSSFLPEPRAFFSEAHETLAAIVLFLLIAHIGGALKHHFMDRNFMLMRMVPRALYKPLNRLRGLGG